MDYTAPTALLKDKIILVTGAGDGIGRVAALTYANYGATVVLLGRTTTKLESVYDEIIASGAPEPGIAPIDLATATPDEIQKLAEVMEEQYGRLDGLLHNAGVLGQRTPLSHYRQDVWDKVLQVNLTAPFQMTQALMPILEKSGDASVVFTSSGVGRTSRAFWGAYAVSKFAIEGMVQTWAAELDELGSVRVNAISPGATATDMRAQAFPAEDPTRLKSAEAIMPMYLYLLGPDSKTINGQSINAQSR